MLLAARGDFSETAQLYLLNENGEAPVKVTDTDAWMRETVMSTPKEMWISTLDTKREGTGICHGTPSQRGRKNVSGGIVYSWRTDTILWVCADL